MPLSIADRWALPKVLAHGVAGFVHREWRNEGPAALFGTVLQSVAARDLRFSPDRSFGQELHRQAQSRGDAIFLTFEGESYSYRDLDDQAARIAQALRDMEIGRGSVVGILMPNIPAFLSVIFATQRVGACAVPINTGLKQDGLGYILGNAGVNVLFTTAEFWPLVELVRAQYPQLQIVMVPDGSGGTADRGAIPYARLQQSKPQAEPDPAVPPATASFLMYTSGTTGYPKGVVYPYGHSQAKLARLSAHLLLEPGDIYYTCLPLFHANALMITVFHSLYADASVALSRRFSASNFWRDVRHSRATIFNTIGTMIAIMMKTAPSPDERGHNVRRVLSAACPADLWDPFQQRFGVQLWEAFGAVDGGGFTAFNFGNAPAGSIGKPLGRKRYRLIDDLGGDVPDGTPGELIHYVGHSRHGQVAYHNDSAATASKLRDGWIHSGDLMRRDAAGFLYFVGRKTDSMRCRGENVSALEIESAADQYPDVLESAAFGVPSELGEQDAMLVVQPRAGATVDPAKLHAWLQGRLPRFAVPRYIRVIAAMPKTGTHRTIKHELKHEGVTPDSWREPVRAEQP